MAGDRRADSGLSVCGRRSMSDAVCCLLLIATKNADQTLAVWRMVQKAAYSEINTDGKVTCACSVDKITNAFVILSTFIMLIKLT